MRWLSNALGKKGGAESCWRSNRFSEKVLSRRWKEMIYRKPMRTRGRVQGANEMRIGRNGDRISNRPGTTTNELEHLSNPQQKSTPTSTAIMYRLRQQHESTSITNYLDEKFT